MSTRLFDPRNNADDRRWLERRLGFPEGVLDGRNLPPMPTDLREVLGETDGQEEPLVSSVRRIYGLEELREAESNRRPPGYEPGEMPTSPPRNDDSTPDKGERE